MNNNTNNNRDLKILQDGSNNWQEKKQQSLLLSESYSRLGEQKRAERIKFCGSDLAFKLNTENGKLKLFAGNFCRERLCSMCAWRRSLKTFAEMSKIMNKLEQEKEYKYLFLTLTIKNCSANDLPGTISELFQGFKRFTKITKFKTAVKGYFRAMEVTHNVNSHSKSFDTYHPHFHLILAVNKSYGASKDYIKKSDWVAMWKKAMNLDYEPSVDIRVANKKAIAEVSKYTVKSKDYIIKHDQTLTDTAVYTLTQALKNKRLIGLGGVFKETAKALKLNMEHSGDEDLININDGDEIRNDLNTIVLYYHWNLGISNYVLREKRS